VFERPKSGEQAVLVHIQFDAERDQEDLNEFIDLVRSAGARDVALVTGTRHTPDPRYFVGSGKAEEIRDAVRDTAAEVVIFDHALSPSQERNLEKLFECRVLDRTGLILDIFAQRARSHEGKLQVELAQLRHMSTRLVRGWTHLERQKGGIGLRGPGETQLESDRRLLGMRIKQIRARLDKVNRQRDQGRQSRRKAETPTVSLVGYTNAGKSTLFNKLTDARVYSANQLFATLDPTLRRLALPDQNEVVLADTVGFIRHLPHDLVAAFRSTLQETLEADLLLHVIDANDERVDDNRAQVNEVLREIGADEIPQIEVYNKIDLMDRGAGIDYEPSGEIRRVWLSAVTGEGIPEFLQALADRFKAEQVHGMLELPATAGRIRARLFELGAIRDESMDEHGDWHLEILLARKDFERVRKQGGLAEDCLELLH
jgi:GTP-binding protein HflX